MKPLLLASVAGVLSVAFAMNVWHGVDQVKPDQVIPARPASVVVTDTFLPNGSIVLMRHVLPPHFAVLTLQTPDVEGSIHFVATIRERETSRLVATVYLDPNSSAVVPMPFGAYRLDVAFGRDWQGHDALFGRGTGVLASPEIITLNRPGSVVQKIEWRPSSDTGVPTGDFLLP